jgi:putative NADH-flavin reductase
MRRATRFAFAALVLILAGVLLHGCTSAVPATRSTVALDILVYGASGKVGGHVVDEALARGHRVTAVSRDPSRIVQSHARLTAVRGDLLDPASVAALLPGHDVVVVSVRGTVGDSGDPADTVTRIGVENVVEAQRALAEQAPRMIHVGGAGSLEVEPGVLYADRLPGLFLPRSLELEIQGQILTLEYLRQVHDVPWTYVTPPKNFTNGSRTAQYRIGGDTLFEDAWGRSRVSRDDFAVALIDEAESAAHLQQRISIAY